MKTPQERADNLVANCFGDFVGEMHAAAAATIRDAVVEERERIVRLLISNAATLETIGDRSAALALREMAAALCARSNP